MPVPGDRPLLQRDAIVAAARELIVAGGLEALSLRRLAGRLGVTAPALYAHVADKRDILRAVAEGELDELMARFDAVDDRSPLARIRAYSRAYVDYSRENPELYQVIFLFPPDLGQGERADGAELPAATKAFATAAGAINEAVDAGLLASDDPLLLALSLWSGVYGVASVLQLGFELPPDLADALVDDVVDRILQGYGAPRP